MRYYDEIILKMARVQTSWLPLIYGQENYRKALRLNSHFGDNAHDKLEDKRTRGCKFLRSVKRKVSGKLIGWTRHTGGVDG